MSEERFDRIDARFDHVDARLDTVENAVDELRTDMRDVRRELAEVRAGLEEVRGGLSRVDHQMRVLHEEVLDRMRALDPTLELRLEMRRRNATLKAKMDSYEVRNEDAHRFFKARLEKLG